MDVDHCREYQRYLLWFWSLLFCHQVSKSLSTPILHTNFHTTEYTCTNSSVSSLDELALKRETLHIQIVIIVIILNVCCPHISIYCIKDQNIGQFDTSVITSLQKSLHLYGRSSIFDHNSMLINFTNRFENYPLDGMNETITLLVTLQILSFDPQLAVFNTSPTNQIKANITQSLYADVNSFKAKIILLSFKRLQRREASDLKYSDRRSGNYN